VPPLFGYDLAFTKGMAHFNQQKYREAIEAFQQALAVSPTTWTPCTTSASP
jgi:Flp pilus assembly protein TadD